MDLNLLVGLDALLEHHSVQDAANALHLTPPAVSRILGRLRTATGDPILVRSGREMVPTVRALELQAEVRELVARSRNVLSPAGEVTLATLARTFTIQCHDALLTAISPGILRAVAATAPQVTLHLVAENPTNARGQGLADIDLVVGNPPPPATFLTTRVVGTDRMILVVRRGGPADVTRPTVELLAQAPHVVVSRRALEHGPIDELLSERALVRRIIATVPTVSAAFALVANSDTVTILPSRLRDPLPAELRDRPLPFALESAPAAVSWHNRHTTDPAHRWLREVVVDTIRGILSA